MSLSEKYKMYATPKGWKKAYPEDKLKASIKRIKGMFCLGYLCKAGKRCHNCKKIDSEVGRGLK